MNFNDSIIYQKARIIVEEVLNDIILSGQKAEIVLIKGLLIQRFYDWYTNAP